MGTTRVVLAALTAGLALTACQPSHAHPATAPTAAATTASRQLAGLPIRTEDTGAHYQRDQWGDWTTQPGGCDTRQSVLRQHSHTDPHVRGCRVTAGTWVSPYDRAVLTDPAAVHIDHRVPVKEALRSGARHWTHEQRQRFYNDPNNLVAVSAHANTSKGDKDPGRWQPSNRDAWCGYAIGYIATKHTYRLTIDQTEHNALAAMLRTCPQVTR